MPAPTSSTTGRPGTPWRRRGIAAATIVISVTVLVTGSVFAFVTANQNDGASDPQEAVRTLVRAAEQRDAIGMLDAMPAPEREAITEPLLDVTDQLRRLGLLTGFPTSDVPGVEIAVDGLTLRTNQLDSEVAKVTTDGGKLTVRWDPARSPITPALRDALARHFGVTLDPDRPELTRDLAADPITLVTVKEAGGWHVSLTYTVAEMLRPDPGPLPRYGNGQIPWGATTASTAVTDLLGAAVALDPARAVALMAPREMRALDDYAPLFLPGAEQEALAAKEDGGYKGEINAVETRVEGSGSLRKVLVTKLQVTFRNRTTQRVLSYDGRCTDETVTDLPSPGTAPNEPRRHHWCDGELPPIETAGPDTAALLTAWQSLGRGMPTFWALERDGRWFVSPIRTVLGTFSEALSSRQPDQVDELSNRLALLGDRYVDPVTERTTPSGGGDSAGASAGAGPSANDTTHGTGLAPDAVGGGGRPG